MTSLRIVTLAAVLGSVAISDLAHSQEMQYPISVVANPSQGMFVADRNLPGIWRVEAGGISEFFKADKKFRTPLNAIRCVALDQDGKLLAGDSATRDIYRFDDDNQPQPLTRVGDKFGQIGIPMDIAVTKEGVIYVADLETHRIVKVAQEGGKLEVVAKIQGCRGLALDSAENLWVISTTTDQLWKLSPGGEPEKIVSGRPFGFPHTVAVDGEGNAYVCDGFAPAIWKVPPGQNPAKLVDGSPLVRPVGMTLHETKLIVSDPHAKKLFEVSLDGSIKEMPLSAP